MARSSRRFGANMPGVSTKTICALPSTAIPRTEARVEKNRADDRFANIAQNRQVGGSYSLFDFAKPDVGVNAPGEGDLGAALLADEAREAT